MKTFQGRYIAFEGPIAAGKTTLAGLLAEEIGTLPVLEQFETNEFLSDYYAEPDRWALAMQLSFLASRYRQLSNLPPNTTVVADHTYAKDEIFAKMLLSHREWHLYDSLRSQLVNAVRNPDLIVLLDAPNSVLLERIKLRGRLYEANIAGEYLDAIRAAYRERFLSTSRTVEVVTGAVNLKDRDELTAIFERIKQALL